MNLKQFGAAAITTVSLAGGGVAVADNQINPYTDKGTHYELPLRADFDQGERVEIAKDRAAMTLKGWRDEYAITVEPQFPISFGAATAERIEARRPLLSKRMEFQKGSVTAFVEPKSENEFDIDFTLDAKPETNVFTYRIEGAEDFDFFYQPALTAEEIAEGASRPENVIGSYAVYHKTKANHRIGDTNYATGKVFHIYRPKAIDANGVETWAELNYDNGVLSVTVPQAFLDEAVYPVRVDPTFGYTSLGASSDSFTVLANSTGDVSGQQGRMYSLSESATLDSLHIAVDMSTGGAETIDLTAAIYREDSAGADTHDLVVQIERLNVEVTTTNAFHDFTASGEALTPDDYILTVIADAEDLTANNLRSNYDVAGSVRSYFETTSGAGGYGTRKAENPWTEVDSSNTRELSYYATYTAGAAATSFNPWQMHAF